MRQSPWPLHLYPARRSVTNEPPHKQTNANAQFLNPQPNWFTYAALDPKELCGAAVSRFSFMLFHVDSKNFIGSSSFQNKKIRKMQQKHQTDAIKASKKRIHEHSPIADSLSTVTRRCPAKMYCWVRIFQICKHLIRVRTQPGWRIDVSLFFSETNDECKKKIQKYKLARNF